MNVPITRRHALLSFGYLFVFYIPYIVLFMIMFRGVHWSKKKACYKWIYYPIYDHYLLLIIGTVWTGHYLLSYLCRKLPTLI